MREKHQLLADVLDGLIHRGDGKIPADIGPLVEVGLRLHNECPDADPAFIQKLGRTLQDQWAPPKRPVWGMPRLAFRLLRIGAAAAAVGALFLVLSLRVPGPQVQAGLSRVISMFRQANVEQTPLQAPTPPEFTPSRSMTGIEQAQAAVGFRIRVPSYLPADLALAQVSVVDAQGQRRVVLSYTDGSAERLSGQGAVSIQEIQSNGSPEAQPLVLQVGLESVERVQMAGRPALWISGHWTPEGRWVRGGQQGILMVQDGDVLIHVQGRLGQAESLHIAESMLQ